MKILLILDSERYTCTSHFDIGRKLGQCCIQIAVMQVSMNCISSKHACFYGGLVDPHIILSIKRCIFRQISKAQKKIMALNGKTNVEFLLHIRVN